MFLTKHLSEFSNFFYQTMYLPLITNQKLKTQRLSVKSASNYVLMKRFILFLAWLCVLPVDGLGEQRFPNAVDQVIKTSLDTVVKGSEFQLGLGSGLEYSGEDNEGYLFWAITDRGPNGKGPRIGTSSTAIFPLPNFQPRAVLVRLSRDFSKASLVRELPLFISDGAKSIPTSGLIPPLSKRYDRDVGITTKLIPIPSAFSGIDPEGITVGRDGYLWIAEEYLPSVLKVSPLDGRITEQFKPGSGLPDILSQRRNNRGFEGITITPSGQDLIIAVQSPLTGESNVRLLRLNISSRKSEMFFLPLLGRKKKNFEDIKIGGIASIDENTFLAIKSLTKPKEAHLIKIGLKEAIPISSDISEESGKIVNLARVETLFSLKDVGWDFDKTEGLALLPDNRTIVLVADNDFGTEVSLDVNLEESQITSSGDLIVPRPVMKIAKRKSKTPIWTIKLKEPLDRSFKSDLKNR